MSTGAGGAEEALASLPRAAADAVVITDAEGVVVGASLAAAQMFGHEVAMLPGRPVGELLTPAEPALDGRWALHDPAEPSGRSLQLCLHHRDGHVLTVYAISVGVTLADRAVVVSTLRNRPGEEEAAWEHLAAVVRSSADAILSMDLSGIITSANAGAQRIYGYAPEEVIGAPVSILLDGDRQREMEEVLAKVGRGEVVEQLQTQRITKSGESVVVSLSASPVRDRRGVIVGAATVARDMSDRALIEEELRRSNRDLEQFAYIASHDLSEPLRVIAGFVDLLARRYRGRLDEDADRFIDFIVGGVERLQALIDDLLAYSRAGRARIERQPVDVGEIVRDVLWALAPQLRDRAVDVDVAPLPVVQAEQAMLRQIFQNLLSNAIKFGDPDQPLVRVGATRLPGAWRFDVTDNGSGVEPRYGERVFEMFQRLHGRDVPGSGMGLAIVKRLTERLGGHVAVAAAKPKGSTFTVTLPDRPRSA